MADSQDCPADLNSLFEIAPPNPEAGLPIWQAKAWYASERQRAVLLRFNKDDDLNGPIRDVPRERRTEVWRFRQALHYNLKVRLQRAELYATGLPSGEDKRREVPPGDWHFADIDVDQEDHATINGVVWKNLLILPGKSTAARAAEASQPIQPVVGGAAPRKRGGKAGHVAETTRAAHRAFAAILYGEKRDKIPRTAAGLSKLAADRAQELSLLGWDNLDPDGGMMRALARDAIETMDRVDGEAVEAKPSGTIRSRQG